jgi:hypothetical protein
MRRNGYLAGDRETDSDDRSTRKMSMTKQVQIAIAAALLIALSTPAFAENTHCMNKIGVCDHGDPHDQPDRAATRGGDAPAAGEGDTDTGETNTGQPDTSQPSAQ